MAKTVVDSYAWIEHFLGSEKGKKADKVLLDSEELYTPDVVLAEVARKYMREGINDSIIEERLGQMEDASSIIGLDSQTALVAAKCYLEMEARAKNQKQPTPSLFDAIVLAVGRALNAKVLTGDQHFKNLPETSWLE